MLIVLHLFFCSGLENPNHRHNEVDSDPPLRPRLVRLGGHDHEHVCRAVDPRCLPRHDRGLHLSVRKPGLQLSLRQVHCHHDVRSPLPLPHPSFSHSHKTRCLIYTYTMNERVMANWISWNNIDASPIARATTVSTPSIARDSCTGEFETFLLFLFFHSRSLRRYASLSPALPLQPLSIRINETDKKVGKKRKRKCLREQDDDVKHPEQDVRDRGFADERRDALELGHDDVRRRQRKRLRLDTDADGLGCRVRTARDRAAGCVGGRCCCCVYVRSVRVGRSGEGR